MKRESGKDRVMEKLKDCFCCKDWSKQQIHALVPESDRIAESPITIRQVLVRETFTKRPYRSAKELGAAGAAKEKNGG